MDLHLSWNQKFLDYEIETIIRWHVLIKSIVCWNQKFLDYEIETGIAAAPPTADTGWSWNQKFLDYEIETVSLV